MILIEELVDFAILLLSCEIALVGVLWFDLTIVWMFVIIVVLCLGMTWLHYNVFRSVN